MKIQLLPSTFDEHGRATLAQHLTCFVIDDCVALDAGSLAFAVNMQQKKSIRDVVLSHAHLDHIAGLPIFLDDLFSHIKTPVRIHATKEVCEILERDIFNWSIYPRFSELTNDFGAIMEYKPFAIGEEFSVKHLTFTAINVNHKVPTVGFFVSDGKTNIAYTSDTAETNEFWKIINESSKLDALFVECSFPNELGELAALSFHLTPNSLQLELSKLKHDCPIFAVNIKPSHHEKVIQEITDLGIANLSIMKPIENLEI